MKPCSFYVITDTHYFKNALGAYGEAYEELMDFEQKCFAETQAINEAVFCFLAGSEEADTVLIAGDLTFDGERESNEAFARLLHDFCEKSGKRVFVVTAGHDCNETPRAFTDEGRYTPQGTAFSELYEFYRDFGYDDAIAFDREHLSYVVDLSEDVRLLALCCDTADTRRAECSDAFLSWIETQARKAQADGKVMIAMEHYPLLPGQPVFSLIGDARAKGCGKLIRTLADNGVHLIFTGHMHNQSINDVMTEKGSKLYDVCTGSVIGHPAYIRLVTVQSEHKVTVRSMPIPDFDWDKRGMSGEAYLKAQFERMIRSLIYSMENDPQRFLRKIRMKDSPAMQKIIHTFGKKLSHMTVGKAARTFFVRADSSIREESFVDFMIDVVRSVFEGNQPFTQGTPGGDLLLQIFKRIAPLVKKLKDSEGEPLDFYETMKHTVGNYGTDDYDAVLYF